MTREINMLFYLFIFRQYVEDTKEFGDVLLSFRKLVKIGGYDDILGHNIRAYLFDVIDNVNAGLGHGEGLVVLAIVGAAMLAVVHLEPCIAYVDTDFGLDAPMGREDPGIAVEGSGGHHVALIAMILQGGIETEGELHVRPVEVAVGGVHADVAAGEGGAEPASDLRRDEEVAILGRLGVVGGERVEASIKAGCPLVAQTQLESQVGSQGGVVEQIVLYNKCLGRGTIGTDEHRCDSERENLQFTSFPHFFDFDHSLCWLTNFFAKIIRISIQTNYYSLMYTYINKKNLMFTFINLKIA